MPISVSPDLRSAGCVNPVLREVAQKIKSIRCGLLMIPINCLSSSPGAPRISDPVLGERPQAWGYLEIRW